MVAYFFPPVGGLGVAGSQRTLKFAKYLDRSLEACCPYRPGILLRVVSFTGSYSSAESSGKRQNHPHRRGQVVDETSQHEKRFAAEVVEWESGDSDNRRPRTEY